MHNERMQGKGIKKGTEFIEIFIIVSLSNKNRDLFWNVLNYLLSRNMCVKKKKKKA